MSVAVSDACRIPVWCRSELRYATTNFILPIKAFAGRESKKLAAAMGSAREQLGVQGRRAPRPGTGGLRGGAGVPQEKPRGFAEAFGPQPK